LGDRRYNLPFLYYRTVRFQDTDAAGVVYFASVLAMCHEAYEESLSTSEICLKQFFQDPDLAVPIVHASVDFFRPLQCGDRLGISVTPQLLSNQEFEVAYCLLPQDQARLVDPIPSDQIVAQALTRHVCIDPGQRRRVNLSPPLIQWLQRWGTSGRFTREETTLDAPLD
jgi:1,4-dihydroxy-2-naphthoyl-CoA hydrolase